MKLEGATTLDIGTVDGLIAFGLSKLGSNIIHATDTHSRQTFLLLSEVLDIRRSCIQYKPNVQIKDLPFIYPEKIFDLAVCAGVFYHMLHPVQAFSDVRKSLKENGFLIIETPFDATSDLPTLMFNGSSHFLNEPYSYFIPTEQALVGIAHLTGFEVIATRILKSPSRITLLLKAVSRSTLIESSAVAPFLKQMLKRDLCDSSFQHAQIESTFVPALDIKGSIDDLEERRIIDPEMEIPIFPFHPSRSLA
jgi:SAM-dependent methyltransferase